ncbi:MAG: hypothetical protein LC797_22610, partial [Chloroflexi bacterium]|nr:hypothetical protein [Chloroflexota bacterium]
MGLAGAAAACLWLFVMVKQQSGQAGAAGPFLAVAGFVAAVLQVLLAWLQLRQGGHPKSVELLSPRERQERDARDRLHVHLGRQGRLRRMDDPATLALALRVHPAIDLPQSADYSAAARSAVRSRPTGWRSLLVRRRRGRSGGACLLDPDLPTFVAREQGREIRRWMCAARDEGGFLLLVGDSSVGKTRLLHESAREVLGDYAVLVPDLGDGDLVNKISEATFPLPKLIVWLDELQRFLDGPYLSPGSTSITASAIRRLLDAPTSVIVVGTLWPQYATQLRAVEPDPTTRQPRSLYPNAVDVLVDHRLHEVSLRTFSAEERHAAARLASQDPRLAEALADRNYNITEVLAGARELVRRYEQATEEQQVILHAAIDARRLGIQAPLTKRLLVAAGRGYLTTLHPDDAWFPPALAELTSSDRPRDRATAPLIPVPNPDHSTVLGYAVADYLLQQLARKRRSTRLSAVTWHALIDHTDNQYDLLRLALNADDRLLYCYAEPLYRRLAAVGQTYAAHRLADLLVKRNAPDDDVTAVFQILIEGFASERGISGNRCYNRLYVNDETCGSIVDRLDQQGRHEIAIRIRWSWADAGDTDAASDLKFDTVKWFRRLLIEQDQTDKAMNVLRAFIEVCGTNAADELAKELRYHGGRWLDELVKQDRAEEAMTVLRALVDAGGRQAARMLTDLLVKQENMAELRAYADAENELDPPVYRDFDPRLAKLLAQRGNIQELQARADAGSWAAAAKLADLL